ncbi:MAG TPA: GH116 family glycosyl-hydrolase [Bacteroidales bacterium]|nr:GH116 family glycosyl-hydrolase [Bacteroidales bacterium]
MKKLIQVLALFLVWNGIFAQSSTDYPVLKHYDKDHLLNIALPLGGIGTGTVSLGGRGELRDWAIMNKPGIGYSTTTKGNNAPFFSIYIKQKGKDPITRALIGPLYPSEYQHYEGRPVNHHGLPRFSEASFDAAYPFGMVNLSDNTMPVKVRIVGFNPLVPGDADASGLPVAVLYYEVTNISDMPVDVSVCGSMRNFVGKDGSKFRRDWKGDIIPTGANHNQNIYKESDIAKGIFMYSDSVADTDPAYGTIALITTEKDGVSYRRSSEPNNWERATLDFWDDFSADGKLTDKPKLYDDDPMASLAVLKEIKAGEKEVFRFFITWNFPNRYAWSPEVVGNYYSTKYTDAWDVAQKVVPEIPELEAKTRQFVNSFLSSSLPDVVKEAALFNLSTLRSQTVFRIKSGHMMGWEGIMDEFGSCQGSCTHVWNYEQATAFLFGDLARTMRDVEFNYATNTVNGKMCFRAGLPLSSACYPDCWAAADGQLGTIMKFYRDWQLSGDNDFLKRNWEKVRKVLSYAWIERGWDGNQDGVMEGEQHNTMDVNYFGPNPQMQFWYMGALRAASEMAKAMNDKEFARKCDDLFARGSKWTDDNLFNGEYYEHKITDPKTFEFLDMSNPDVSIPDYQLGRGCLVDQLVGQYMAHVCGLGYLASPDKMKTTLLSIMKYNYKDDFSPVFNNMRSYVIGHEPGLIMASWPHGRLKVPFPYFSESMTGFEYTAAVGMLFEGQTENGLKCIKAIRSRFDGQKRNPFDEPECGHHYARAMASWASVLALTGFRYSGVNQSFAIRSDEGKYFWSNGYAWGTIEIKNNGKAKQAFLNVDFGKISVKSLILNGFGEIKNKKPITVTAGNSFRFDVNENNKNNGFPD